MRYLPVLASLALLVMATSSSAAPTSARCQFGRVQGFISIRDDPLYLVGTIPNRYSDSPRFFARRYNCKRRSAGVRRVDLGTYDVIFPGLGGRVAFVTAISDEGVAASVRPMGSGVYRVVLRGPYVIKDILVRRDVAFSLAVF